MEAAEVLKDDEPEVVFSILENALKREENNIELRFKQAVVREAIEPNENAGYLANTLATGRVFIATRTRCRSTASRAREYLAAKDYSRFCEFGRLAMEFAEPGEGQSRHL